jgi:glutamine synthetase
MHLFNISPVRTFFGKHAKHLLVGIIQNIVQNEVIIKYSQAAESFIAGVLAKSPEITLFLNPLANSYERFGKFEAPKYVSWSHQNRS